MYKYTFSALDTETGNNVEIVRHTDYLPEILDAFLQLLKGNTYYYVKSVGAEYEDGRVVWNEV